MRGCTCLADAERKEAHALILVERGHDFLAEAAGKSWRERRARRLLRDGAAQYFQMALELNTEAIVERHRHSQHLAWARRRSW